MLTTVLAALVLAAAVAGILCVTRGRRRPGIRPARELQREFQLYAENRPVIRLDPSQVPPNLRHLVVSQSALDFLGSFSLKNCEMSFWKG